MARKLAAVTSECRSGVLSCLRSLFFPCRKLAPLMTHLQSRRAKPFSGILIVLAGCCHAVTAIAEALTVANAIQTSRFVASASETITRAPDGQVRLFGSSEVFVSPDSKMWAVMLIRGDLERNGNWAELVSGSLESLDHAQHPRTIARFFTQSLGDGQSGGGGAVDLTRSVNPRPLQWLEDSHRLALLWDDGSSRKQIFIVDARTGKVRKLSAHLTSINAFTHHGSLFLYNADYNFDEDAPTQAALARREQAKGVTVETRNLLAALQGEFNGRTEGRYFKWYILDATTGASKEVAGLGVGRWDWTGAAFSPDGRFAVVDSSPESLPDSWDLYTERFWSRAIRRARSNRNDGVGRQVKQLYVVDVRRGTARPLWNAPAWHGTKVAWSPDGRALAMSTTFVPAAHADADGLSGLATVVVDVTTGIHSTIPIPSSVAVRAAASLRWTDPETIEMQDEDALYQYRWSTGGWKRMSRTRRANKPASTRYAGIDVRVEEDLNSPPVLVAIDRSSGRRRVILDPNPRLQDKYTLGRVVMTDWRDPEGRTWHGRLYYPVQWKAGHRYPLVIQTSGYTRPGSSQKFSLYGFDLGAGLGPGQSVHAAQPLANRGIVVLSVERKELPGISGTPRDAPMHVAAYEAAIDHLDRMGLVDRKRVGISGFSNTGYLVQYALVHSTFRYAAAITDDNFDGSYLQSLLLASKTYANVNGAEPFGTGLQAWIERAPGFNADKVRTPLRLQVTTSPQSILGSWEMFTRLRELDRPVEFFLIPEIQRGAHGIQNPAQCLASQEGAVDWFDFWLNEREDADASKADQYSRWRRLRSLNDNVAVSDMRP